MKCDVFSKSIGLCSSSLGKSLDRLLIPGTNSAMASGGRLLGLQLPPVPSHISDFMPACVRSTHNGDANECSGSSAGLFAFSPSSLKLNGGSADLGTDLSNLDEPQALKSRSSSESSNYVEVAEHEADVEKVMAEEQRAANSKEKGTVVESRTLPTSGWTPHFTLGSNAIEGDATAAPDETGENSHSHGHGLRSKLSSMLSLEKRVAVSGLPLAIGHSSQYTMEMSGFQPTSLNRRAPMVDSKICAVVQKESFARMFDLYDERKLMASVLGYGASSGCIGRSTDNTDAGIKTDSSWIEEKCNEAWGREPWHSDQRNILMKTLHIMRCDIESLKMTLRSLDLPVARGNPLDPHPHETTGDKPCKHSVTVRTSSTMSETKQNSHQPSDDEQIANKRLLLREDKELAQTTQKDGSFEGVQDLCATKKEPEKRDEDKEPTSVWAHGCPRKKKQWWKEILAAFGLTVWVITGAVLVAKAIGVPNLGVSNNVAYNGFWGRSDDDEPKTPTHSSQGAMGVVELTTYTFNDIVKKRPTFVMFYAPWCPHCQHLHLVWTQLASVLMKKGYDVQLAIVDATKHTRLANKYEVPGFPTLIMFKNGVPVGRHRGARDIETLMSFIDNNK